MGSGAERGLVNLEATLMGQEADFKFQPWIASVQYTNQEHWSLTAEYALRQQSLSGDHLPRTFDITGESWYVQYQRASLPTGAADSLRPAGQ
ncbi:hypothetical protein [Sphingopyxis terrae]|uniref:hypothetical protein n=1 Tax=Sphingopyxis terrae TaxID=33052 RepID=UPI0036390F54